jgi:hypothetical protein
MINIFLGTGLKAAIESIDNRHDFKVYMQNYVYARGGVVSRGPRREGPSDEGFVSTRVLTPATNSSMGLVASATLTYKSSLPKRGPWYAKYIQPTNTR